MAMQISYNDIKRYQVESNPYLIIERRNAKSDFFTTEKIILDELTPNKVLFEFGEFTKIDIIFIGNSKNDFLEIECFKEFEDDLFITLKSKQKANISPGGDSLVPGEYSIKFFRKDERYELLYKITSTNISNDKLKSMRDVVDNFLFGLSKNKNSNLLPTQDKDINYILSKLVNRPIVDITKDRFGRKILTNDTIENRIIKNILNSLRFNDSYINYSIENTWLKDIKPSKSIKPTLRLLKENNYSQVYNIFKSNMKEKNIPYKRTSVLFEIYSFVSILNILEEFDFRWVSGWIKDNDVYDLEKGEVLYFKKDGLTIKLSFDKELKENSKVIMNKEKEISQLCVSGDIVCRKPDILLELYNEKVLIDSMIIEAKYRKQRNIDYLYQNVSKQILSYRRFDYFDSRTKKILSKKPVSKIIIFYPKQEKEREEHFMYDDLIFLPSDTRESQTELKLEISNFINNSNKNFDMDYNQDLFVAVTT